MNKRLALLCSILAAAGCVKTSVRSRQASFQRVTLLREVGAKLFADSSLSGNGKTSCASCHAPLLAYGPPNDLVPGMRAVPSLRYLQAVPHFTEHHFDEDAPDPGLDNGPTGGLTWDGRVNRVRDQVLMPLLSKTEMNGGSPAAVLIRLRKAPYFQDLAHLAGAEPAVFSTLLEAFEVYLQTEREFYPYNSKFDDWKRGRAQLSAPEKHGFELFNDPTKGNCASCHVTESGRAGVLPQFSDYGYAALGVPGLAGYNDYGLCGPERTDFANRREYCGMFRTPSLRNVATRSSFFHNGAIHNLREAVAFYFERDMKPDKWTVPAQYRENLVTTPPFGRTPDGRMRVSETEIDDIAAFLQTLSDAAPNTR